MEWIGGGWGQLVWELSCSARAAATPELSDLVVPSPPPF